MCRRVKSCFPIPHLPHKIHIRIPALTGNGKWPVQGSRKTLLIDNNLKLEFYNIQRDLPTMHLDAMRNSIECKHLTCLCLILPFLCMRNPQKEKICTETKRTPLIYRLGQAHIQILSQFYAGLIDRYM